MKSYASRTGFNLIQDWGRGQKDPPTLPTFPLWLLQKCELAFKGIPNNNPKLLNLNQDHTLVFRVKSLQIWNYIEMLVLPNFGYMNTSTTEYVPREKMLLMTTWTWIMTSLNYFIFSLFPEGLEFPILLTHQVCNNVDQNNFKDAMKIKNIRNHVLK